MQTLLQRSKLWNPEVSKHPISITQDCAPCHAAEHPEPPRKVSVANIQRSINAEAFIDHLFLEKTPVLHAMEAQGRFSLVAPVASTSIPHAIEFMETRYFTELWPPAAIHEDAAFYATEFPEWCTSHDITFHPIPARRHNKLSIESKHRILREIFIRLRAALPDAPLPLLVARMFEASNKLYGNSVMSSHEYVKGFTKPLRPSSAPIRIPPDLRAAQDELIQRKLRSES